MTPKTPWLTIMRLIPIVVVAATMAACGGTDVPDGDIISDGNIPGDTSTLDTTGTDTVGTDTQRIDTVGTDTAGIDTVGTDTAGTDTVGTDTTGTDTTLDSGDTTEPMYSGPCRINERLDPLCTGTPESCVITQTDIAGNPVLVKKDSNCDFIPPFTDCEMKTFDDAGHVLTYGQSPICSATPNSACATFTYDEFGRKITETLDEECTGIPGECYTYTYDGSGNLITKQTDTGCAGISLQCLRQTFDSKGNMLTSQVDVDCDNNSSGDFNCIAYTYYGSGQLATTTTDGDCNSTPNYCYRYDYFNIVGRGTVVVEEFNNCAGGNRICRNSTYGRGFQYLTSYEVDTGCDGTPEMDCKKIHYDANGNKAKEEVDSNCNETMDYCSYWIYAGDGTLVLQMKTPDCTEAPIDCASWNFEGTCATVVESDVKTNGPIECGTPINGNNGTSGHAMFSEYNCIGWTPTGKEVIYNYTAPVEGCDTRWKVTADLTSLTVDLDLLLLTELKPNSCRGKSIKTGTGAEQIIFEAAPGSDNYLIIESYAGATGTYTLNLTCECVVVPVPTCEDQCGGTSLDGTCGCGHACNFLDNCCPDRCAKCPEICAAENCGEIDSDGLCDGNIAKRCDMGVLLTEDCGAETCTMVGFGVPHEFNLCPAGIPSNICNNTMLLYPGYRPQCK
jgi:hypothetical protein